MCARYSLTKEGLVIQIGEIEIVITIGARYNIAPGDLKRPLPVIAMRQGKPELMPMYWGWWVEAQKSRRKNSKAESIRKGIYPASEFHPCLIPADGFYEWQNGIPNMFDKPRKEVFCFAGIFRLVLNPDAEEEEYLPFFSIVTTRPNAIIKPYHPDAMPVILKPENYFRWLTHYDPRDINTLLPLDQNDNDDLLRCQVQPELNKVTSEGSELIRPYFPPQRDLF